MAKAWMGRAVTGLLAALLAAWAVAGCELRDILPSKRPTARVAGVSLKDVGLQAATMLFDIEVENPYDVPLPLANLDYRLASLGQAFLSGEAALQGTVPAAGRKTVSLPARVSYAELLKVLKDVTPGSVVPYNAEVGLSVDAPAIGPLRLPLKKEGRLPVPAAPEVEVKAIEWSKVTLEEAAGRVSLHVVNRNRFPVDLSTLTYALSLGGVEVATSSLARAVAFKADGGAGDVEIPLSFSPRKAGLAFLGMLTGKGSGYDLKGTMDVGTPFGPMSLPVSKVGETVFRK